jgi:hypothetical protein
MIWKYLIPFDRFGIECDIPPGEALARIAAATATPRWFSRTSDLPLEGNISDATFRVTRAALPFDFFSFNRTENAFRALAIGRVTAEGRGCRIDVRLRPQNQTLLFFGLLEIFFSPVLAVAFEDGTPGELAIATLLTGGLYLILTGGFWGMAPSVRRSLMQVLNDVPA